MKDDAIYVDELTVSCNGTITNNGAAPEHPKIYLHIDLDKKNATCPYCGQIYISKYA